MSDEYGQTSIVIRACAEIITCESLEWKVEQHRVTEAKLNQKESLKLNSSNKTWCGTYGKLIKVTER